MVPKELYLAAQKELSVIREENKKLIFEAGQKTPDREFKGTMVELLPALCSSPWWSTEFSVGDTVSEYAATSIPDPYNCPDISTVNMEGAPLLWKRNPLYLVTCKRRSLLC